MIDEAPVVADDKLREARGVVEDLLRSTFPNTNFTSIRLQPDLDHDGDPVLRVTTFYRGSAAEIDSTAGHGFGLNLWRRLRAIGITAFPIHMFWDVDEEPYGACS